MSRDPAYHDTAGEFVNLRCMSGGTSDSAGPPFVRCGGAALRQSHPTNSQTGQAGLPRCPPICEPLNHIEEHRRQQDSEQCDPQHSGKYRSAKSAPHFRSCAFAQN